MSLILAWSFLNFFKFSFLFNFYYDVIKKTTHKFLIICSFANKKFYFFPMLIDWRVSIINYCVA